jgi:hypothetical protein
LAARDLPGGLPGAWVRQGTMTQPFSRQSFFGQWAKWLFVTPEDFLKKQPPEQAGYPKC